MNLPEIVSPEEWETANKRILLSDFLTVINDLTADGTPDQTADYVVTYDASAATSEICTNFFVGCAASSTLSITCCSVMPRAWSKDLTSRDVWYVNWCSV